MDLSSDIVKCIESMQKSGKIEEILKDQVSSLIKNQINCAFRYSDFTEAFEKKLQSELLIALKDMSFQSYNHAIVQILTKAVEDGYVAVAKDQMSDYLGKLFKKPLESYSLSKLVENIKEGVDSCGGCNDGEITLIVEHSDISKSRWVYIDQKQNVEKYKCEFRLLVSDNKLRIFEVQDILRGWKNVTSKIFHDGKHFSKIEMDMFHMIVSENEFIVDEDEVDVYYEWGGDR